MRTLNECSSFRQLRAIRCHAESWEATGNRRQRERTLQHLGVVRTTSCSGVLWAAVMLTAISNFGVQSDPISSERPLPSVCDAKQDIPCSQNIDLGASMTVFQAMKFWNCTVLEGHISLMGFRHFISFPCLREVRDFVMLKRLRGIKSLQHIFPSLSVIRGQHLFSGFALVVIQCDELEELGIASLTLVDRGGIHIEKNPSLCFLTTVNWDLIGVRRAKRHFLENVCSGHCSQSCPDYCKPPGYCWNHQLCQKVCSSKNCRYCNRAGDCCHKECLGGCEDTTANSCFACKNVLYNGTCLPHCPLGFYRMGYRCVTEAGCLAQPENPGVFGLAKTEIEMFKIHSAGGTCVEQCPDGYKQQCSRESRECVQCSSEHGCPKSCVGRIISTREDAEHFQGCTRVNGALELKLRDTVVVEHLTANLGDIEEIEFDLKVIRSHQLYSLSFFKKLRKIKGLRRDFSGLPARLALHVMDNQNLRELFGNETDLKVVIQGPASFHYNPFLCMSTIKNVAHSIHNLKYSWSIGYDTNGHRAACNVSDLPVAVTDRSSTSIHLRWPSFDSQLKDDRHLSNYVVSYREAPATVKLEHYSNRSACGKCYWIDRAVQPSKEAMVGAIVTGLKPATRYAFYVTTDVFSTYNTSGRRGARSVVFYNTTDEDIPDPPMDVKSHKVSFDAMNISWVAPVVTNGPITEYQVEISREKDSQIPNICRFHEPTSSAKERTKRRTSLLPMNAAQDTKLADENGRCYVGRSIDSSMRSLSVEYEDYLLDRLIQLQLKESDVTCSYVIGDCVMDCHQKERRRRRSFLSLNDTLQTNAIMKAPNDANVEKTTARATTSKPLRRNSTLFSVGPLTKNVEFRELLPYTRYRIAVRACHQKRCFKTSGSTSELRCEQVCSSWNDDTVERTLVNPDGDFIPEDSIKLVRLNSTSALVSWSPPTSPNAAILGYHVRIKSEKLIDPHCLLLKDLPQLQFTIAGIVPGYITVTICALSNARVEKNCSMSTPRIIYMTETESIQPVIYAYVILGALGLVVAASLTVYFGLLQYRRYLWPPLDLDSGELEIPQGRVKLLERLANGEFGRVYRGCVSKLPSGERKMYVAVKVPIDSSQKRTAIARCEVRRRFEDELRIVLRLQDGPHIVRVFGVVTQFPPFMLVMELMNGGDLRAWLEKKRPDPEHLSVHGADPEFVRATTLMCCQVADAMAFIHSKNVLHRDLAARNCFLDDDPPGRCSVGDFGHATAMDLSERTDVGIPVRWTAPEVGLGGERCSPESDVWSYGVLVWEIASFGRMPYEEQKLNDEVRHFIQNGGRLTLPNGCPLLFRRLMYLSLRKKKKRPTFQYLVRYLYDQLAPDLALKFRENCFVDLSTTDCISIRDWDHLDER